MLTIQECRKLLGPDLDLTDDEIEQMRDGLYALADIALNAYFEERDRVQRRGAIGGAE